MKSRSKPFLARPDYINAKVGKNFFATIFKKIKNVLCACAVPVPINKFNVCFVCLFVEL